MWHPRRFLAFGPPDGLRRWAVGCVFSTAALALTVELLRPLRIDLGLTNVALVLLLLSVTSAAAWG